MKKYLFVLSVLLTLSGGCKKDEVPSAPVIDNSTVFPPSSNYSIKIYTDKQSVTVNESFTVKVILYNVSQVFGSAVEIYYPQSKIAVESASIGSFFTPSTDVISLNKIEPDSGKVSFGASFKAGTTQGKGGSGIIFLLSCKGKLSGNVDMIINRVKLGITKSDGSTIDNITQLQIENLSLLVN